jgi:hypothetical protein
MTVVENLVEPLQSLKTSIAARRFLGLPRTIPSSHSLDMMVRGGRLSDWLVAAMASELSRYTLNPRNALALFHCDNDEFVWSLKEVFGDRFYRKIELPLAELV